MTGEHSSLPRHKSPSLRVLALPAYTNQMGDIFGGWIMSQVDIAGSIPAARRAKGRVVTVKVNSLEFHRPVCVGDLISCYAEVVLVGRSSLTVDVDVYAERNPGQTQVIHVTQATLTYVAVDANGRPRAVPPA
jgi:acyl-CoA thioesterase YciA